MSRRLPFSELLDTLRQRGMALSVRECELFYRLLERWPGEAQSELRDAIAALLGKSAQDIALIRVVFDELTAPPPPRPVVPPRRLKWRRVIALCVALIVTGGSAYGAWLRWGPHEVPPVEQVVPPNPAPPIGTERPPPEPPPAEKVELIDAPASERWPWMGGVALAASAAMLLAYARLRPRQQRLRARERALKLLPGPQNFELPAPPYQAFSALDLDEFATWLGRISDARVPSRTLDIDRSVRASVRSAMPRLVFAPRPPSQPLIVLDDVSEEMRPWRRKLDAFVQGIEQRGISIERWYFGADPSFVSRQPFGARVPLSKLAGRAGETSLLVLSSGSGVLDMEQQPAAWLRTAAQFERRVWLHPVTDPLCWRRELARVPFSVQALSRPGLAAAARALGADVPEPSLRAPAPRPTSAEDVAALRTLAAIYPEADLPLLMALRERLLPDVSESAILLLRDERAAWGEGHMRFSSDERWSALRDAQHLSTEREQQLRQLLLQLLSANEPPPGSAAHLRWRLSRAQQHAFLPEHVESAHHELGELADSAIGVEVEDVLSFMRRAPSSDAVRALGRAGRRATRRGWAAPRLGDVLRALVVGGALGPLALLPPQQPHERSELLPNQIQPAYTLELMQNESTSPPRKGLLRVGIPEGLKRPTELLRSLPAGGFDVLPVQLDAESNQSVTGGYWYLVRGKQARGEAWVISEWRKAGTNPTLVFRFVDKLSGGELTVKRFTVSGKQVYSGSSGSELSLPNGTYLLEARVEGYQSQAVSFNVPHPTKELVVELDPDMRDGIALATGVRPMLVSFVLPTELDASDLQIDGKPWSGKPLRVPPGAKLKLRAENAYYDYVEVVTAAPRIIVAAKPTYGLLRVITPQGFASELDIDPPLTSFGPETNRIDGSRTREYRGTPASYTVKDRAGGLVQSVELIAGQTVQLRLEPKPVASKPNFVLDLEKGTLNGLPADVSRDTLKKELPLFTANEGQYGPGWYYDGFGFLDRQAIWIDSGFNGTVTPYGLSQLNEQALDKDTRFTRVREAPLAAAYERSGRCVELLRGTHRLALVVVHARPCSAAPLIGDYTPPAPAATPPPAIPITVALRKCGGGDGKAYQPLPAVAACLERIELQSPPDPAILENVVLELMPQPQVQQTSVPVQILAAVFSTSPGFQYPAAAACLQALDASALAPWQGTKTSAIVCAFSLEIARAAPSAE